jgi:hypothetical protein
MTLVTIGLLLGHLGLIWTMVIRKPMGHESRAA